MTTVFALLLSFSVFASSSSLSKYSKSTFNRDSKVQENFIPTFTDSTFTAQNETSVDVGWLTIHSIDSTNGNINVTGTGTFTTTISDYPLTCSIHGQSFGIGIPTWIIIDAHTRVRATWTASVVVMDVSETY